MALLYRALIRSAWKSIRVRVLLASMVPIALLAVVVVSLQWNAYSRALLQVEDRGQLLAQSFSDAAVVGVIARDTVTLQALARAFVARHKEIASIEIWSGRDGDSLVRYVADVDPALSDAAKPLLSSNAHPIFRDDVRIVAGALDIELFAANASTTHPSASTVGSVALALNVEALDADIWRQQWAVIFSVILILALSVFISRYLVGWSVAPLRSAIASFRKAGDAADEGPTTDVDVLERAVTAATESRVEQILRIDSLLNKRTKALRASVEQERAANQQRRLLIQRMNATIDAERKSIAGELHDELGATCTLIRMSAERIAKLSSSDAVSHDIGRINSNASEIVDLSKDVYTSVRRIVRQLGPETLETLGLSTALQELVDSYNEAQSGELFFRVFIDRKCDALPFSLKMAVYRTTQEALTNVVKHAKARECHLSVHMDWVAHQLQLEIEDDGVGLPVSDRPRGLGMIGMSDRIEGLGGELRFTVPRTGHGTRITATLPLPPL